MERCGWGIVGRRFHRWRTRHPWAALRQPLNEGAKLNINSLDLSPDAQLQSRQRLLMIPGMDTEVADSILDWLDDDDERGNLALNPIGMFRRVAELALTSVQ